MKYKDEIQELVTLVNELPTAIVESIDVLTKLTLPGISSRYGQSKVMGDIHPDVKETVECLYTQWVTYIGKDTFISLVNVMQELIDDLATPELEKKLSMKPDEPTIALIEVLSPEEMMKDKVYTMLIILRCYVL